MAVQEIHVPRLRTELPLPPPQWSLRLACKLPGLECWSPGVGEALGAWGSTSLGDQDVCCRLPWPGLVFTGLVCTTPPLLQPLCPSWEHPSPSLQLPHPTPPPTSQPSLLHQATAGVHSSKRIGPGGHQHKNNNKGCALVFSSFTVT